MIRQLDRLPAPAWVAAGTAALGGLAALVGLSPAVLAFDVLASRGIHDEAVRPVTEWSILVSQLGASETALAVTLAGVVALCSLRHWRGALALAIAFGATQGLVHLIKVVVERPRPDDALIHAGGFSFPSAHSATSMAVYGGIAFIAARACRGTARAAVALAGAALVAAIGLSRVYLGAHYPTDVLAGWLTGALLVGAAWVVLTRLRVGEPHYAAA